MPLAPRISALATRIASEFKSVRADVAAIPRLSVDPNDADYYVVTPTPVAGSGAWAGYLLQNVKRISQFSWSGTGWVDVEGVEIKLNTLGGPVNLKAIGGMLVTDNAAVTQTFYIRILDADGLREVAIGLVTVVGVSGSPTNAAGCPPLETILQAGIPERRYVLQVQARQAHSGTYIAPSWLENAAVELIAIGC